MPFAPSPIRITIFIGVMVTIPKWGGYYCFTHITAITAYYISLYLIRITSMAMNGQCEKHEGAVDHYTRTCWQLYQWPEKEIRTGCGYIIIWYHTYRDVLAMIISMTGDFSILPVGPEMSDRLPSPLEPDVYKSHLPMVPIFSELNPPLTLKISWEEWWTNRSDLFSNLWNWWNNPILMGKLISDRTVDSWGYEVAPQNPLANLVCNFNFTRIYGMFFSLVFMGIVN